MNEPFDFRCMECGKSFEAPLEGREFECPQCRTGWKLDAGRWFIRVLKRIE